MVEVFTAGCPCCDDTAKLVQSMACGSCEVRIMDMRSDPDGQAKANRYGVRRVPSVVVDGKLADCCQGTVDQKVLRNMGIGTRT